jgi:hypothetical protein
MEIESIRLLITEPELNALAARLANHNDAMHGLRIQLSPQGIQIAGTYNMMISLPFESLWQISVSEGKLRARLADLRTAGLPMGVFKTPLLRSIAAKTSCLRADGDAVLLDLDILLKDRAGSIRTHLSAVRCAQGTLTVEGSAQIST